MQPEELEHDSDAELGRKRKIARPAASGPRGTAKLPKAKETHHGEEEELPHCREDNDAIWEELQ
jgi:hypothetical protein